MIEGNWIKVRPAGGGDFNNAIAGKLGCYRF
jgi:hypothetical protein